MSLVQQDHSTAHLQDTHRSTCFIGRLEHCFSYQVSLLARKSSINTALLLKRMFCLAFLARSNSQVSAGLAVRREKSGLSRAETDVSSAAQEHEETSCGSLMMILQSAR